MMSRWVERHGAWIAIAAVVAVLAISVVASAHPHPRSHLEIACDSAAQLAGYDWSHSETMVPLAALLEAIAEHCSGLDGELPENR